MTEGMGEALAGWPPPALDAAGPFAAPISTLSAVLFAMGAAVLLIVTVALVVAVWGGPRWKARLGGERIIWIGGLAFPIVVLSAVLVYGLTVTGRITPDPDPDAQRVRVTGEMWWWRVAYLDADGREVLQDANEVHIPTGQPVVFELESADVIHSFWVPNLGGKVDMIPGRTNRLRLTAGEAGISRGQCAEYCGGAHALMSFFVVALPPEEYRIWRQREAQPARPPSDEARAAGLELFLAGGCGACHAIRGTEARGTIGPDLTHLGSRHSLAAGTLRNDRASIARWIAESQHVKPENLMPPYGIFTDAERDLIATYLAGLE